MQLIDSIHQSFPGMQSRTPSFLQFSKLFEFGGQYIRDSAGYL